MVVAARMRDMAVGRCDGAAGSPEVNCADLTEKRGQTVIELSRNRLACPPLCFERGQAEWRRRPAHRGAHCARWASCGMTSPRTIFTVAATLAHHTASNAGAMKAAGVTTLGAPVTISKAESGALIVVVGGRHIRHTMTASRVGDLTTSRQALRQAGSL
eukprot:scaffold3418_cov124-Isochrysis_galbana.AAC.13